MLNGICNITPEMIFTIYTIAGSYLPVSQLVPVMWGGQLHLYLRILSVHVPPLRHGILAHSSMASEIEHYNIIINHDMLGTTRVYNMNLPTPYIPHIKYISSNIHQQ